ncbi:DUF4192 family protein [Streptomyces sp. MUM 136J]|nr:DUF4192 family protein [Streptomyces sp. MUM 136J]
MTHHGEKTDSFENGETSGSSGSGETAASRRNGEGSGLLPGDERTGLPPGGGGTGFLPDGEGTVGKRGGEPADPLPGGGATGRLQQGEGSSLLPGGGGTGFPQGEGADFLPGGEGAGLVQGCEATSSLPEGGITAPLGDGGSGGPFGSGGRTAPAHLAGHDGPLGHGSPADPHEVTLRSPSELADALPYLLGYRPEDSIVLVAVHGGGERGRFGGRARLGIPAGQEDWTAAARQLAHGLVTGCERRGARPGQLVAYLCQEPTEGETGQQVMERLEPLARALRVQCGLLDVPVVEALCISDGRFWSYCCAGEACCPPAGLPMGLPGTSVLAAAAAYAGIRVRGTLRELRARMLPWENAGTLGQQNALDAAGAALVPRILDDAERVRVAEETVELAGRIIGRYADAPPVSGTLTADRRDDGLLDHGEAAQLILGLQDRTTRDRAAQWMEGDEAGPALRLWRALARRCVGPYGEHAAAPLTLAGWVAWSTGDDIEAREAFAMALGADPDYLFARLLHQAVNEGLDPESVRRCLRTERRTRGTAPDAERPAGATSDSGGSGAAAPADDEGEGDGGGGEGGGREPGTAAGAEPTAAHGTGTVAAPRIRVGTPSRLRRSITRGSAGRTRRPDAVDVRTASAPGVPARDRSGSRRPPASPAGGTRPRTAGQDAPQRSVPRVYDALSASTDGLHPDDGGGGGPRA